MCWWLGRIRIDRLKGRVDNSGKRDEVMLKSGDLRCQRAIHAQNFSSVTQGFLSAARSADGHGIQQDLVQRIQAARKFVQVDQEE